MAKDNSLDWIVGGAAFALLWAMMAPNKEVPARRGVTMAAVYDDEYTPDEENAQLTIFRNLSEEGQRWVARCQRRVAQLLHSLDREDADRPLFTFFERKSFDIPVTHRPRPKV